MSEQQAVRREYVLTRVYAAELEYRLTSPSSSDPLDEEVTLRWDWRFSDELDVEVMLELSLGSTQSRPEEVRASYVGVYDIPDGPPARTLNELVRQTAPVDLLPYVTEAISALTARGFFGAVVLPPLNIGTLLPQSDEQALGVQQARENSALAALLSQLNETSDDAATGEAKPVAGESSRS